MDNIKVNFDNVDVTEKNIMKYAEEVEKVHDELHKKANNPKEFFRMDGITNQVWQKGIWKN